MSVSVDVLIPQKSHIDLSDKMLPSDFGLDDYVLSNLFDDVKLLQTGLSSLSDTLFSVVEGLPYQYANLTAFTTLSDDYEAYKITNNTNFQILSDDYEQFKINNSTNLLG